jgi:preprotein translocase subunit SecG
MTGFIIGIHVVACVILIGLVLIQRGKGGGLIESFSGVESMFGTKTNALLARLTTVLSIVFFMTCLCLAVLSIRQSRSLMGNVKPQEGAAPAAQETVPAAKQETVPAAAVPLPGQEGASKTE